MIIADVRWRRLAPIALAGLPIVFIVHGGLLLSLSGSVGYALAAAALQTGALTLNLLAVARSAWAANLTGERRLRLLVVLWALQPALATALVLGALGWSAPWAIAGGTAAGLLGSLAYARGRSGITRMQVGQPLAMDSLREAGTVDAATATPPDPTVPAGNRAVERLNRARALTLLAVQEDSVDRVQEALPLLRDAIHDPGLDPVFALAAADDLVNAESGMAERSRDDRRYAAAIALFTEIVRENPGVPAGRAKLHGHRAEFLTFQAGRVSADLAEAERTGNDDAARRARDTMRDLLDRTERERREAVRHAPAGTPIHAQERALLGLLLCHAVEAGAPDRSDEGVGLIRDSLRRLRGLSPETEQICLLHLAQALLMRAQQRGDDRDVTEAKGILDRLVSAGPPIDASAHELLLTVRTL